MALIGNRSVYNKSPGRFLSGTAISGDRSSFSKHGMIRNSYQSLNAKAAIPCGYQSPGAWVMAKTAGGLSSHLEGTVTVTATANGLMGYPISAEVSFGISTNQPSGQLIVSGQGEASFEITLNTPQLTATRNGEGSAELSTVVANALLGAIAGLTGGSNLSVAGSLVPYAIGKMEGAALPYTELSPQSLASAVWQAISDNYTDSGTMGQKVNAAGAAGDPWVASLPGDYAGTQAGSILNQISELVFELHTLQGLNVDSPVTHTLNAITAGNIDISLTGNGTTERTLERQS